MKYEPSEFNIALSLRQWNLSGSPLPTYCDKGLTCYNEEDYISIREDAIRRGICYVSRNWSDITLDSDIRYTVHFISEEHLAQFQMKYL